MRRPQLEMGKQQVAGATLALSTQRRRRRRRPISRWCELSHLISAAFYCLLLPPPARPLARICLTPRLLVQAQVDLPAATYKRARGEKVGSKFGRNRPALGRPRNFVLICSLGLAAAAIAECPRQLIVPARPPTNRSLVMASGRRVTNCKLQM